MDGTRNLFILSSSGSAATNSSAVVKTAPGSGGPGTGPVTIQPAELEFPDAILVDGAGNFYITDDGPLTVLKLTPEGVQTTVATGLNALLGWLWMQSVISTSRGLAGSSTCETSGRRQPSDPGANQHPNLT
jgi:hypothetical protein